MLNEIEIDINNLDNLELKNSITPLQDDFETYTTVNTGQSYGLLVQRDFLNFLKGSNGEKEFYQPIESKVPSTVHTFAYITFLRNVEGNTLEDKKMRDMANFNNLGVDLLTKKLIDRNNIDNTEIKYKDYDLDISKLYVKSLTDDIVVIQTEYLECVNWGSYEFNTNVWIDVMPFLEKDEFKGKLSNGEEVNLENYTMENGFINTEIGKKNPFLMFAVQTQEKYPFKRFIAYLHSDEGKAYIPEEYRTKFIKQIENHFSERKLSEEYKQILKDIGEYKPNPLVFIIPISIIILIIGFLYYFLVIRKNKNNFE